MLTYVLEERRIYVGTHLSTCWEPYVSAYSQIYLRTSKCTCMNILIANSIFVLSHASLLASTELKQAAESITYYQAYEQMESSKKQQIDQGTLIKSLIMPMESGDPVKIQTGIAYIYLDTHTAMNKEDTSSCWLMYLKKEGYM